MCWGALQTGLAPPVLLRCSCICGGAAALMVILVRDWRLALVMYALLAVAVNGVMMSNNIAMRGIFRQCAHTHLCCGIRPFMRPAVCGELVCRGGHRGTLSYTAVFLIAMAVYAACALLTFTLKDAKAGGR